jgi:hypothetical protein
VAAKLLTRDEARRIAANIAKLGDIYTAVVDSLKVLDSERPIREAVLDRNDFDPTA